MAKRLFDLLVSGAGLIIISPLLLLVAALIKATSPGPVFYRGERVGRFGRPFWIYKFRTMVVDAEKLGGPSTSDQDPRITRVGRFLRKTKLDELPQLINVLKGEMSLVGPRPEVRQYVDMYTSEERALLQLRPGITDWASIWNSDEGAILADADDPDKAYEELIRPTKLRLQLAYARQHSLWIDLKILCNTLRAVLDRGFVPAEVSAILSDSDLEAGNRRSGDFGRVTELPGMGGTHEQISMLHTRYRLARELCAGKDVLELACGPGIGLGCLTSRARSVMAGDFDASFVEAAARHYRGRVDVRCLDAQQLPLDDESIDVILLLEAIYFLPRPEQFVTQARRVLRADGRILIVSANCERPDFNASPQSQRYFAARELQSLLAGSGFEVDLFAAYPVREQGRAGKLLQTIRRIAVRMRLVPGSMQWKTRIKRLVFGPLTPLPRELTLDDSQCAELIPIDARESVLEYKVIYAIGRRAA
jgi:lipopolysaccharide/colanic/teichoic acid biosynthesis glycosyltransferase/SAM-dependent methyltransferase